ncbi:hypothetical protein L484_005496 [Morus notabilis]|uniref:Uncharacterized protein n=1 Tax=Morus notabilis TaxID=981085 RepID=W9RVK2_9ROSA|nr:hypothetical protein L484_005496 [Morus notabilis]
MRAYPHSDRGNENSKEDQLVEALPVAVWNALIYQTFIVTIAISNTGNDDWFLLFAISNTNDDWNETTQKSEERDDSHRRGSTRFVDRAST